MKMSERKEKLFAVITLALCLLLFLERLTGEICHVVLGMCLVIMTLVHVCRQIGKLKYKKTSVQLADWGIFAALAVLLFTGMLLHPLQDMLLIKMLHKLSAVFLTSGIIVHVVQHRK